MSEARHSKQTVAEGIHIVHAFEFVDNTARDAASYTAADVGKVARVGAAAPYVFSVLTDESGPTFTTIGGAALVSSVFGRVGAVVAVASDYDASQVDNDSGVAGATVAAALDTLDGGKIDDTLFDANTILKADVDDTPLALSVPASSFVGRLAAGAIAALTGTQATTLLDAFTTALKGLVPAGVRTNVIVEEHFLGNNIQNDRIGQHGWHFNKSGTGNSISYTGEAGHPGVIIIDPGSTTNGRNAIYLGDTNDSVLMAGANDIELECLVKFRNSIASANLEIHQMGLATNPNFANTGEFTDGVYLRVVGGATPVFEAVAASASTRSVVTGTTAIALDTWYRVGFILSDPDGSPSLQLYVNGVAEGTPTGSNIPSAPLSPVLKADGAGGGTEPHMWVDYYNLSQDNDLED